jgi:hypothetical protein
MKTIVGQISERKDQILEWVGGIGPKTKKRVIWTAATLFVLQMYFVRELIAAELLFGLLFAAVFLFVAICYVLGTIGVDGLEWTEAGARVVAATARRYYSVAGDISKKPFRHPHSESAR